MNSPAGALDPFGLCDDLEGCFLSAQIWYLQANNAANWKVYVYDDLLLKTGAIIATTSVGLYIVGSKGAPVADMAGGVILLGDAALMVHTISERRKLQREIDEELKKRLEACAEKSSDPEASKKAAGSYERLTHRKYEGRPGHK